MVLHMNTVEPYIIYFLYNSKMDDRNRFSSYPFNVSLYRTSCYWKWEINLKLLNKLIYCEREDELPINVKQIQPDHHMKQSRSSCSVMCCACKLCLDTTSLSWHISCYIEMYQCYLIWKIHIFVHNVKFNKICLTLGDFISSSFIDN